jgi:transposase-like protein
MAAQKGPQRSAGKEQFWRRIVEGHAGSRESVRQWCSRHGVSEPSFYAWRRELTTRDARGGRPALLPVTITSSAAQAPLEICWPDGLVVRVPAGCDLRLLRGALEVMRSLDAEIEPC